MSLDTPFGSEDLMQIGRYEEPDCATCEDEGRTERPDGTTVPCWVCRPDEYDHVVACGGIEP
jgi:hypothetical protein